MKSRLDILLVSRGLAQSRSQAENLIRLGKVIVDDKLAHKPGLFVDEKSRLVVTGEQYVSRAALKLASVAEVLNIDFKDKTVLDIGSSTGGFTDFALRQGAKKVIAVDVGTNQLHQKLRLDSRIELHEKTDIRNYKTRESVDIFLADVSFMSLREILPAVTRLMNKQSLLVAMVKPQFEATNNEIKHKGVIKNYSQRRKILKDFETWAKSFFVLIDKADSGVAGNKGNVERFYLLKLI